MIDVIDEQQVMEKIYDNYFVNKDYWIFLMPRFNQINVINRIERTFYNGEKNKDFILITKRDGAYVCAKKEHLPYNKLHNFHPLLKNSKEINDIIIFYEDQKDHNFISEFYLGLGTVMEIRKNRI